MREGVKSLAGQSAVYAVATAAGPLAALVAVPILTRELGPAGFGVIDLLLVITTVAGMVGTLGMDGAAARSYYETDEGSRERAAVVATAVRAVALASLAVVAAGAAVAGALELLGVELTEPGAVAAALAMVPIVTTATTARESFRLSGRTGWFVAVAATAAFAGAGGALILVVALDLGPAGYFAGLGIGALLALLLALAADPALVRTRWDRGRLRTMLAFGVPLVPASISVWALQLADRGVVAAFRGADEVGLYGVGSRATIPLFLAVQAFQIAWIPFALRAYQEDPERERELRARVTTLAMAATAAGAVAIILFAGPLVDLLGGAAFAEAEDAVLPLALGWVAYAAVGALTMPFSTEKRSGTLAALAGVVAVVNVALALLLVPPYGFAGAAWATMASYVLFAVLVYVAGQRLSPVRLEAGRIGLVVLVLAAVAFLVAR